METADLATARHLVDQDPAARADVLVYELHRLLPYFDALSGASAQGAAKDQARRAPDPIANHRSAAGAHAASMEGSAMHSPSICPERP
jgi:hypothetical protein